MAVEGPVEEALFDPDEVNHAVLGAVLAGPVESWMAFPHPDQARLVRRACGGPARIRGAAGTGKTVLNLHRAAYLASAPGPPTPPSTGPGRGWDAPRHWPVSRCRSTGARRSTTS